MTIEAFLLILLMGLIAGAVAGVIFRGAGFGIIGNIVVGVIGAFVGSFLFGLFGIGAGTWVGQLLIAIVGAIVLLALLQFLVGITRKSS